MTAHQGNGEPIFRVSASADVLANLKLLEQEAVEGESKHRFLEALKQIYQQLQHDPRAIGEPLYQLSALRLTIYLAAIAPLVVSYAVHEERPLVFIRWFKTLS